MNGSSEVDPVAYFIFVLDLRYTNTVPVTRTQQLSAALSTWFLVTTLTEYADILYRISNVRIGQLLRCFKVRSKAHPVEGGGKGRVATDITSYSRQLYRLENQHDVVIMCDVITP